MSDKLLRPDEAARKLGIDASTLRRYAAKGEIEAVVTPGGHRRYRDRDLRGLVSSRAAGRRGRD